MLEIRLVTTFRPLMTTGAVELVIQIVGEARFVACSKLKAGKFVGQLITVFPRTKMMVNCGRHEHRLGLRPYVRLMLVPFIMKLPTATALALVSGLTVPFVDWMITLVRPMFMLPARVNSLVTVLVILPGKS